MQVQFSWGLMFKQVVKKFGKCPADVRSIIIIIMQCEWPSCGWLLKNVQCLIFFCSESGGDKKSNSCAHWYSDVDRACGLVSGFCRICWLLITLVFFIFILIVCLVGYHVACCSISISGRSSSISISGRSSIISGGIILFGLSFDLRQARNWEYFISIDCYCQCKSERKFSKHDFWLLVSFFV